MGHSNASTAGGPLREAKSTGDSIASARWFEWLARAGLVARGAIYGIIGVLALEVAFGAGGKTTNQKGALAELAQQPGRDRLVVDERAAAAVGLDDAADDQGLAGIEGEAVFIEQGGRRMIGRDLEGDADRRLPLAGADEAAVGASAEGEAERVEQDRFPGPGLAGQHAEARSEFELERVDQHDVADRETGQHGKKARDIESVFTSFPRKRESSAA